MSFSLFKMSIRFKSINSCFRRTSLYEGKIPFCCKTVRHMSKILIFWRGFNKQMAFLFIRCLQCTAVESCVNETTRLQNSLDTITSRWWFLPFHFSTQSPPDCSCLYGRHSLQNTRSFSTVFEALPPSFYIHAMADDR